MKCTVCTTLDLGMGLAVARHPDVVVDAVLQRLLFCATEPRQLPAAGRHPHLLRILPHSLLLRLECQLDMADQGGRRLSVEPA